MRRLLTGLVVAAVTAVVPVLALAGNQDVADEIANRLRGSGQMSDYKIGVKYQDGTAWLRGRVASGEQMETALRLVFQTAQVDRVVNELTIAPSAEQQPAVNTAARGDNPLRDSQPGQYGLARRLESAVNRVPESFTQTPVEQTAAEEPQELPRQMAVPRPMARMAMMQPEMRGPMAPSGQPRPMYTAAASRAGVAPARYDQPCMPNYAWPSYAAYPNYAAVTYPKQYSPTAWPYIGPFYPYPQVPLGWRKVTLEWDDGWWFLDFSDQPSSCWHR